MEFQGQASEELIEILYSLEKKYKPNSIIYANGPGSFMGLKVAYVILKTYTIAKNIKFQAVSAFELNNFGPIRANKNFSFVYENGDINLKKVQAADFALPKKLNLLNLSDDTLPNYVIDAV